MIARFSSILALTVTAYIIALRDIIRESCVSFVGDTEFSFVKRKKGCLGGKKRNEGRTSISATGNKPSSFFVIHLFTRNPMRLVVGEREWIFSSLRRSKVFSVGPCICVGIEWCFGSASSHKKRPLSQRTSHGMVNN